MKPYIVVLRAVNFSKQDQIKKEDLQSKIIDIGIPTNMIRTFEPKDVDNQYNEKIIFRCDDISPEELRNKIEKSFIDIYAKNIKVLYKTPKELEEIIRKDSFSENPNNYNTVLYLTFIMPQTIPDREKYQIKAREEIRCGELFEAQNSSEYTYVMIEANPKNGFVDSALKDLPFEKPVKTGYNYRTTSSRMKRLQKVFETSTDQSQDYESVFNVTENKKVLDYNIMNQPLNQILYGPPGTGKTYNTINRALEILGENTKDLPREEIKNLFNDKVKDGEIVFTTFHQSMSYEDFIEGIKPVEPEKEGDPVIYRIEAGIFKRLCDKSKSIKQTTNNVDWESPRYYKMSLGGKNRPDLHEWCIENNTIGLGWGGSENLEEFLSIQSWQTFRDKFNTEFPDLVKESRFNVQATYAFLNMKIGDIVVISKGNHIIDAIGIVKSEYYWDDTNPIEFFHFRKVEWIATNLNTTPDRFFRKQISQMAIYEFYDQDVKKEAFKELTGQVPESTAKPVVLIIDEINRGNVSQIFGELITLIEDDKRLDRAEALEVTLPYSKEKFGVPPNLYIIGTMNTADRSVEALDNALRRRFSFEEMPPNYDLLSKVVDGMQLKHILQTINKRVEKLLDKDHLIGHSYFLSVDSLQDLKKAFHNKIIPLLQEYFFGDFGKIGLVLGEGFFDFSEEVTDANVFAIFQNYDSSGLEDKRIFRLNNVLEMSDVYFKNALMSLLK